MLLAVNKLRPALEHSWFALTDENPLLVRLAETDFKRSAFSFEISLVIWSAAAMNAASSGWRVQKSWLSSAQIRQSN